MRFNVTPEQQTINYNASNPAKLTIGARSSWIIGLILELELAKTDSASPGTYQDFLYRAMSSIVLAGGKRTYLQVNNPDTRILYWANRMRMAGRGRTPDMQAGAVTFLHQLPILFTPNPVNSDDHRNEYDTLVGIKPSEDLALTVTWAANTALGANRTVGTGTLLRVTYIEAIPESDDETPKYYPQWISGNWTPQQVYNNYGGSIALDTGLLYRRMHFMNLLGASPNDVRTDGKAGNAISEIGIKASDNRVPIGYKMWDFSQRSQGQFHVADDNAAVPGATAAYGAASTAVAYNPGVGFFDFVRGGDPAKVDKVFGVNLIGSPLNALRIGLTADAISNVMSVYMTEGYGRY